MIAWLDGDRRTFTIECCLGRGGFGEVYRAAMTTSTGASLVALKVLRRDLSPDGQAMQRLRDEGRMLARLDHPSILKVYEFVVLDGRVSLVTEYVDGEDLERCLKGTDPMPLRPLLEVLSHVASALGAAYDAPLDERGPLRLVHRDVKPSNVRISRHGEVKLLDFGIARSDEMTREARTLTDTMIGSPPYMAPERFLDAEVRPASDVFALGAVLVEGITHVRTFDLPVTILASHAVDRGRFDRLVAEKIAAIGDRAPPEVVALARELLAYDPAARPTAADLARRCDTLADAVGGPSLARWCRERTWAEPARHAGEFAGRVLTHEGTLDRPRQDEPPPAPVPAPRPARGLGLALGGVSLLSAAAVILGIAAAAAAVAAAVLVWPKPVAVAPEPGSVEAPEPEAEAPVPEPVEEPPPEPVEAVPRPRAPVAQPEVAPEPEPEVAAPVPAPPAVAPEPVGTGRVTSLGDAPAELVQDGVHHALPAEVAPGTYEVWAAFGAGAATATGTRLTVAPGGTHAVDCKKRMSRCSAR